MMAGFCHIMTNPRQDKDNYIRTCNQVFTGFLTPDTDQVKNFLTTGPDPINIDILTRITKPSIFSLNHQNVDETYPKRLWRISKNLSLRYQNQWWAFCYELKDIFLDYLNNHHKFSQDN
jgi:hypothetical protein